jgi:polar amino acid transport system substrate-binding protein
MVQTRLLVAAAFAAALVSVGPCHAQTIVSPGVAIVPERELIVGTKEAPPFAMKAADGTWQGISIELWRRMADELHLRYRFSEEATVQDLLEGVAARKFDIAVAALTVTAARERTVDFTQPYYATGLGIAVPIAGAASWLPVIRSITSFGFAQAVVALVGLAVSVGFLIWLFERNRNEDFGGGVTKGLSSGVMWSASAMTQRHTGSFSPRTVPGRIVATIWMVVSIIAIAVFTAGITSALTTKQLRGMVHSVADLSSVRVGAVSGTSAEDVLVRLRIAHRGFKTPQEGIKALQRGTIDALVYDKPLLAWIIRENFSASVELLDITFDPQNYAFAVPEGASFGKALNIAILDATHSDWWEQTLSRYLGYK